MRLANADAKAKPILFELAGARRLAEAEPAILASLSDPNPQVRLAAITALGQLVELGSLDVLIERAIGGGYPEETAAAQSALKRTSLRMSDRNAAAAKLAAHVKATRPRTKHIFWS